MLEKCFFFSNRMLLAGMESQGLMEVTANSNFWIKASLKKKRQKIRKREFPPSHPRSIGNEEAEKTVFPAVAQEISTAEVVPSPISGGIQLSLHQDAYRIFSPYASRLQINLKWEGIRKFHASSSSPTQVKCSSIHRNTKQTRKKNQGSSTWIFSSSHTDLLFL